MSTQQTKVRPPKAKKLLSKITTITKPLAKVTDSNKSKSVKLKEAKKSQASNNGQSLGHHKKQRELTPSNSEREILYPTVTVKLFSGNSPLTVSVAKKILGWQNESENIKFKSNFLLKDEYGEKVRCYNNYKNRHLNAVVVQQYRQEILCRNWKLNGETCIVGKTGVLLDGQHTLIALVLAAQEWETHPGKWKDYWSDEPFVEKVVVFGVEEDDATANSINNGKSRTLADVIYRSALFDSVKQKQRNIMAKLCDYAVRLIWYRTGSSVNAFAPKRTHTESMKFIERHPKILECVKHVYEENGKDNNIAKYIGLGYASGLLYLMGCSSSSSEDYLANDPPNENSLDWTNWEKACEMFVLLAQNEKRVAAVRKGLGNMLNEGGGAFVERCALLVKAWNSFVQLDKVTEEDIQLEYVVNDNDQRKLVEIPTLEGIDFGSLELRREATGEYKERKEESPKPAKGKKRKANKFDSDAADNRPVSKTGKAKRKGELWSEGDYAWVIPTDDTTPYFAKVLGEQFGTVRGDLITVQEGDQEWEVPVALLSLQPPPK